MNYYKVTTHHNHGYKDYVVLANDETHAKQIPATNGKRIAPCSVYQIDEYPRKQGLITFMPENKNKKILPLLIQLNGAQ